MTQWTEAFARLQASAADIGLAITERPGQTQLAEAVFNATTQGGVLLGEAAVGTGKSVAYLVPLIYATRGATNTTRAVVSTETTALQDQLVDKDLPMLHKLFGPFKFRSLKGRSWYLCKSRAGQSHPVVEKLGNRDLGNGERRDVERLLGYRLDADTWEEISGETEFCSGNKCTADRGCYSTKARNLAMDADIVVTNHALLRTHAEMDDGLLGEFQHLVIDEAHTLEHVLVDGWGQELRPYDVYKSFDALWDAMDATRLKYSHGGRVEEGERLFRDALKSIVSLYTVLAERRDGVRPDDRTWVRESFTLSEVYISGAVDAKLRLALEEYEVQGPARFKVASEIFADIQKQIENEIRDLRDQEKRVTRKISKGRTAAKKLAEVAGMVADALVTRDGIVTRFGVPYAVLGEGQKAWKGEFNVTIRCVPLDVSERARETIWKGLKSAVLVSGTLHDETTGDFRYVCDSLGIDMGQARSLIVKSSFDYEANQLMYVTPGTYEPIEVNHAQYAIDELVNVIEASRGRALVLFTANAEMEYASQHLRDLQQRGQFPHLLLVQERGITKQELVDAFTHDTSSVLLGSKSFFTGVDFPGETCSTVVIAKYPRPRWDPLCRAQTAYWRKRGYPHWYARESMQVFRQAQGRLIRSETDRGVIAILDRRAANPKDDIARLVGLEVAATGSRVTNNITEMAQWLHATAPIER